MDFGDNPTTSENGLDANDTDCLEAEEVKLLFLLLLVHFVLRVSSRSDVCQGWLME
jgi:hypothetical protein